MSGTCPHGTNIRRGCPECATPKRTPGPLRIDGETSADVDGQTYEVHIVRNGAEEWAAYCEDVEYAAFIVEACNAYDTLRAENERLREALADAHLSLCVIADNPIRPMGTATLTAIEAKERARAALKGKDGGE